MRRVRTQAADDLEVLGRRGQDQVGRVEVGAEQLSGPEALVDGSTAAQLSSGGRVHRLVDVPSAGARAL